MQQTTVGQLPYPESGDPADGASQSQALADRLASIIESKTTAQRDALTGTELWAGRLLYNTSTSRLEVWTGSAWVAAGVSDHAQLSGLATGDPHTQYLRKDVATAKGDLLVAAAAGVISRLGKGAAGQLLTATADTISWTGMADSLGALLGGKGSLLVHNGTTAASLPAGTAGLVLAVDPTAPTGLKWAAGAPPAAGYQETVTDLGSVSGAVTVDFTSSNHVIISPTAAVTLTFSGAAGASRIRPGTLIVVNPSKHAITFPAGTRFAGGKAPKVEGETWLTVAHTPAIGALAGGWRVGATSYTAMSVPS